MAFIYLGFARPNHQEVIFTITSLNEGSKSHWSQALKSFAFTYKTFSTQNPRKFLYARERLHIITFIILNCFLDNFANKFLLILVIFIKISLKKEQKRTKKSKL
jgi:hypothetical protein